MLAGRRSQPNQFADQQESHGLLDQTNHSNTSYCLSSPSGKWQGPRIQSRASCSLSDTASSRLRWLTLGLFLLATLLLLYTIYNNATGLAGAPDELQEAIASARRSRTQLKLVSALNRHGDRAPSDSLAPGDKFRERPDFFWPNGQANLTESGKFRQYRIGLQLRQRYGDQLLDFNSTHFLAFSSPVYRCRESLEHTLKGLFDIDWTIGRGLAMIRQQQCPERELNTINQNSRHNCHRPKLPSGSGSPLEYKRIAIDIETIPVLTYDYLNKCKFRLEHPTPIDADLSSSEAIRKLEGIEILKQILADRYQDHWNFDTLGLYSNLACETRLARTEATFEFGWQLYDWATRLVAAHANSTESPITLMDLLEEVSLLGYRDRVVGTARRIQLGPIIKSLVVSQQAALAEQQHDEKRANGSTGKFDAPHLYKAKKMVIYSSHDSILQLLLHQLGVIRASDEEDGDYETRFRKWHQADEHARFMAGLRMCKYGLSLVFELYEMAPKVRPHDEPATAAGSQTRPFAFVEASLYNQEDGKYQPIEYRKLKFGSICRRLFKRQQLDLSQTSSFFTSTELDLALDAQFYHQSKFPIDRELSCPFELFKNVTSDLSMDSVELEKLCT